MKKGWMFVMMLLLAAQVAWAQAPATPDTAAATPTQTTQAAPPPTTPPPPPPPPPAQPRARSVRYGSISGSWLRPTGDFEKVASDGWAITLEGFQFITPTQKVAIGTQVGYQSFSEKDNNGVEFSNFPVDAILKFYPKPGTGKIDIYGTAGLGFIWQRVDVGFGSESDYFFGTQAGAGVELHTNGPASIIVDGTYHWVFADALDTNFIAARVGLMVPLNR